MRPLRYVLSLALAGAALSAVPALQNSAAGQPAMLVRHADTTLVGRMKSEASGTVRLSSSARHRRDRHGSARR